MSGPGGKNEIPEDVFRDEFGGRRLHSEMADQQRSNIRVLAMWGILIFLVGAPVLSVVAWGLIKMRHCAWGMLC